ncbi:MAG: class I SAM-dependent methyltransferase [Mycobacterium sp.]
MLDAHATGLIYRIGSTATYKKLFKYWYPFMTKRLAGAGDKDVVFLNWGYEEDPPMGIPLDAADEADRYSIQLYHRVATQTDITGKKVLEVSCGHGGGASYLTRTLRPACYTGLDFNAAAIDFDKERHKMARLEFVCGDAHALPFAAASFDVVINVEASHIYPDFDKFVREVARVLRPGGHFLYTDFLNRANFPAWDVGLAQPGLRVVSRTDISRNVLRGLTHNSARTVDLIDRYSPAYLRRFTSEFAVVEGSMFYRDLERGELEYRVYHLVKD